MKIHNLNHSLIFVLSCVFSAFFIFCPVSIAQDVIPFNDRIASPAEEKFSPAFDLVAPWRETGCFMFNRSFREPGCKIITIAERRATDSLALYDESGEIWYRFSLSSAKKDYFLKNKKKEFLPFAPVLREEIRDYEPAGPPAMVILRMVGESEHWYEVEINEKTRETKFVLKSDPTWAKTTWSFWLYYEVAISIDVKVKLLDQPNGKTIESSAEIEFGRVKFVKAEGDWAYVEGFHQNRKYLGWVRWRNGRDLLVGCIFNENKIPTQIN